MGSDEQFVMFATNLGAVPVGYFTSYGQIAKTCGVHVRQVQAWLRRLPSDTELPWYRIINGQRKISDYPGSIRQHKLLAAEGLFPEANGRFPLDRYVTYDVR